MMNVIKMESVRKMMKKLLLTAPLAAMFTAAVLLPAAAAPSEGMGADMAMPVFTAGVTLQDMAVGGGAASMTVKLDSGVTDVGVGVMCCFWDEGDNPVSPSDFLKRYQGQEITIDFVEVTQGVYSIQECRPGRE